MISVVIPAYNEAKTLGKCLRSLQEQDYRGEYEIIVVDNGSTDDTTRVAESLGAQVVYEPRRGVCFARQRGAQEARGEIIATTDADVIVPPHWLSSISRHFEEDPQLIALAGTIYYREKSPFWVRFHLPLPLLANKLAEKLAGAPLFIWAGNFSFRKKAFLRAGGYDLNMAYVAGDEMGLVLRLKKVGKVALDPALKVGVSPRRYQQQGLLHYLLVDFLFHRVINFWLVRIFHKSPARNRRPVSEEETRQPRWRWATLGMALLLVLGFMTYLSLDAQSQVYGQVYAKGATLDKRIALSFDDGPNEPYTSQILDILQRYDVKATFFVVGANVERYPEVARRIAAEGHIVGNHSYSHRWQAALADPNYTDFIKAQKVLWEVVGVKPALFRTPYGFHTPWQMQKVRNSKITVVAWSVSANDPQQPPSEVIARRIIDKTRSGGIILLHDGEETRLGADRSRTVAALPVILEELSDRGYTFVTVPELLGKTAYLGQKTESAGN